MWIYAIPICCAGAASLLSLIPVVAVDEVVSVVAATAATVASIVFLFLPGTVGPILFVDGISKLMLLTISLVYLSATVFSVTYLKYVGNPLFRKRIYYFLLNVFALTMVFSVSVSNLGLVWFGVEATTVTSALLVALDNNEAAIEASWRYVIIVSTGLVISLVANILLYATSGSLDAASLGGSSVSGHLASLAAALAVIGYGTKAGLFPLYTWLPDVHGKAPSPVSGLFSAVLLPVAVFAIIRFLGVVASPGARLFLFILGVLTLATAALILTVQRDLKRMFAYSTIENMGTVLLGVSLGGAAAVGAVVLLIAHAFAKSAAFYLSGNILARYGTVRIAEIRGVGRTMPMTGITLFFASLAVTGAPPFGAFVGELLILSGVYARYGLAVAGLVGLLIAISFMAVNARVVSAVFSPVRGERRERGIVGVAVPLASTALSLAVVVFVPAIGRILSGVIGL
ncbi:MAG TPA: proton-conducting transporter membrane subunit [Spirochaetia bacterium]|nr:proton-conducting transporter membrane subunit [Spirochaetia bacterium]